eukprot:jgi/Chrzof1/4586/Cz14g19080.t1
MKQSLLSLSVLLLAWAASAARLPVDILDNSVLSATSPDGSVASGIESLTFDLSTFASYDSEGFEQYLTNELERHGPKHGFKVRIAVKYFVKPDKQENFIEKYQRFQKAVRKEKGNVAYGLAKTGEDNVGFLAYGVWESFRDFFCHIKSEHARHFMDFIEESDIIAKFHFLIKIGGGGRRNMEMLSENVDTSNSGRRRPAVRVLVKYVVPPGKALDFIDAWKDAAEDVEDHEKGNIAYSLSKPVGDNIIFWSYAAWEDWKDVRDHFSSKHVRRLIKYLSDDGIVAFSTPLFGIPARRDD